LKTKRETVHTDRWGNNSWLEYQTKKKQKRK